MIHADIAIRLANYHVRELQRANSKVYASQVLYPDREHQPRILKHWANR